MSRGPHLTGPRAPTGALLRLDGVTCTYGHGDVVVDASLAVSDDDLLGIVGPSGSGKTTLLRAMVGTLRPRRGRIERRPGLRIGYVPQREAVDWTFPVTVGEVLLMARPREGRRLPWASRQERTEVAAVLERLGLGGLDDRHIGELSGGQQQRAFIARALVRRPHVLVMDEPTSGVDVATRHELLRLLGEIHAGGTAVVVTTHDLNGMAAHLPRLVCVNRRLVAEGSPGDVLRPGVLEATYGAPMDVICHHGSLVVVDRPGGTGRPGLPRLDGSSRPAPAGRRASGA
ncbi:MAG TPA: metal ABC transporter ATP-binding protein [Acidimicrobiales bacterium]|nr:metal ABC transporter ATP-binding protein [Acidimicrobiales bacterium]